MKKNVLVISTSLRKEGNSSSLAERFVQGAIAAGNSVETISLYDKRIAFCNGCMACQMMKNGKCVLQDDMQDILDKMINAEVLVFATPIYFYEMCGQMKTLLDRTNPLFPLDYAFRDIYLLATAADDERKAFDGAIKGLSGWIECFDKARLRGVIYGSGVDEVGAIKKQYDTLDEAYQMGFLIA